MPMRNRHELGIMFANAFHHEEGQAVAILGMQDGTAPKYTAYATGRLAAADTCTPIVNLFQGAAEQRINSSNRDVYCSYVPTTACFGILRMHQARAVYFIHNGVLRRVVIGAVGAVPTVANVVNLPAENLRQNVASGAGAADNWHVGGAAAVRQTAATWIDRIVTPEGSDAAKAALSALTMVGPMREVGHVAAFTLNAPATTQQAVRVAFRDELFMSIVRMLASVTWTGDDSEGQVGQLRIDTRTATGQNIIPPGKNISALLVANDTRIVGWGINTNDRNGTRHAETNAIQAYQQNNGTALPQTVRLYTSLQPCFMCAGLYSHAGGAACFYDQSDPGMVGTALANTEQQYAGAFNMAGSFGRELNVRNAAIIPNGHQVAIRAPDFLQRQEAARVYSYAVQRFVTHGMKAQTLAERQLWTECLNFLKNGPLGPIMERPDLFLID